VPASGVATAAPHASEPPSAVTAANRKAITAPYVTSTPANSATTAPGGKDRCVKGGRRARMEGSQVKQGPLREQESEVCQ
jgi:hypothetical protein